MNSASSTIPASNLHAGDLVEIRSAEEVLATLDADGTVESMPFMPEMLKFCGKRFRVFKRSNKTCDTIDKTGLRRMKNAVLLEGVRCDGAAHGGCEAGCLIFWKEQWLKRVQGDSKSGDPVIHIESSEPNPVAPARLHSDIEAGLSSKAQVNSLSDTCGEPVFRCQITEIKKATVPLSWWDPRQYVEDVTSGNRSILEVLAGLCIMFFNTVQRMRGGDIYPYMEQGTQKKTPVGATNLQKGDLVRVKTTEEIRATLDQGYRNRGLWFDVGMLRYCGDRFRVGGRAHRIIHEKTGKMIRMPEDNPLIILEGVICHADYQKFCPRSEYLFWREIWLEKIS